MGFGGLISRYSDSVVRRFDLPRIFSGPGHPATGARHFGPSGLDVDLRGYGSALQGWTPEVGFIPSRWDDYSELMMMYLLGMGSSSHPLRPDMWFAWKRTIFEYDGLRYIGSFAPLFVTSTRRHGSIFRHKRDRYADYFSELDHRY